MRAPSVVVPFPIGVRRMSQVSRRVFLGRSLAAAAAAELSVRAHATWGATESDARTGSAGTGLGQNHNDPGLHLFVDDGEIERIERLSRVVNRLRKHLE